MNKKIIFVHGYTASSKVNWYPNISKELDKLGVDYSIPDFPGGTDPHSKDWLEIIDREVKSTDKPIILVGHSLGTRAILLYLDKRGSSFDAVVLISPPANKNRDEDSRAADFFEHEIELMRLQNRSGKFIVVHSRDDRDCPYEGGVDIAKGLGAKLITFEDRDHMSEPENAKHVLEVLRGVLP